MQFQVHTGKVPVSGVGKKLRLCSQSYDWYHSNVFFFADLNGLKNPLTHILPPSLKIFTCGTEPSQT